MVVLKTLDKQATSLPICLTCLNLCATNVCLDRIHQTPDATDCRARRTDSEEIHNMKDKIVRTNNKLKHGEQKISRSVMGGAMSGAMGGVEVGHSPRTLEPQWLTGSLMDPRLGSVEVARPHICMCNGTRSFDMSSSPRFWKDVAAYAEPWVASGVARHSSKTGTKTYAIHFSRIPDRWSLVQAVEQKP